MCDCNSTNTNCNCPSPTGIEGSTLDKYFETAFESPQNIYNGGVGYTITLYTNTDSINKNIIIESNMYVSCDIVHTLSTVYKNDGVIVASAGTMLQTADTKTDHTHFMTPQIVAPGKSITITVLSNDATGLLNWLVAMVYKY